MALATSASEKASLSRLRIVSPDLPKDTPYTLEPGQPTPGPPSLLRLPIAATRGTGILTCFPSTTPFGLTLGADSPCADYRCAGTLGLPACGFFTRIIVTHVSIRTSDTSSATSRRAFDGLRNAPLPCFAASAASVHRLSPVTSSAQADSTSELLRFL